MFSVLIWSKLLEEILTDPLAYWHSLAHESYYNTIDPYRAQNYIL